METQPPFKTPQEIFEAISKNAENFMMGIGNDQMQEMIKEFSRSWQSLASQSFGDPQEWVETMTRYQQEQMGLWARMMGLSTEDDAEQSMFSSEDRRFSAQEWQENPVFNYMKQSYLLASGLLQEMAEKTGLDEENQRKLSFYTRYFIDAMSPANFAATNPEVLKEALDSKGQSLIDGLKNLVGDMEKGRITMTDEKAFKLGENLATTPGAVIYENELMQLIQYKPTTKEVLDRPIVITPPCINKFYILDLSPGNSFVKYCVDQGYTVFLISWLNPDREHSHYTWDDYVEKGPLTAFQVAREITGASQVNAVSWCVGGTILASALSVLHGRQQQADVASATFFTTLLDFSDPGEIGVFIDDKQLQQREAMLKLTGILSGKDLAIAFSMLRANDLIWSYVVNNYLKGKTPPPFDILYWNADSTNLPGTMYSYYLHNMYMGNKLIEPGALTICGVPTDLTNISTPGYFLSTIDDHIAPWKGTFTATELFNGPLEFVLGASGHIAGVINPAVKNKRNYWVGGESGKGADHWLDTASTVNGSWWPHWSEWIGKQGGKQVKAPAALGGGQYKEIEPAPGRYVMRRIS